MAGTQYTRKDDREEDLSTALYHLVKSIPSHVLLAFIKEKGSAECKKLASEECDRLAAHYGEDAAKLASDLDNLMQSQHEVYFDA